MNRKILAIVNTNINLALCIQVRRGLFPDDEFDLIIGDERAHLPYQLGHLTDVFTHAYYYDYRRYQPTIQKYINPKISLDEIFDGDYRDDYTDVFFWNPDWILYNLYKRNYKKNIRYHMYTDGVALYAGKPNGFAKYTHKATAILNTLDRLFWDWHDDTKMPYDMYLFREDFLTYEETDHEIISIPQMTAEDISVISGVFGYQPVSFDEKVIFLDAARYDYVDGEEAFRILDDVVEAAGKDQVLVRAHPKTDKKIYASRNLHLMDNAILWELYYLNEDLSDKIILSPMSGGLIQPYLWAGKIDATTIAMDKFFETDCRLKSGFDALYQAVGKETGKIIFPETEEEMLTFLNRKRLETE